MLSRTADHLYWMARYVERAENLARLLDVNVSAALLPRSTEEANQSWAASLAVVGALDAYTERYGAIDPRHVLELIAFDPASPFSIVRCLREARENARAVRGALTTEIWETMNTTWLDLHRRIAGTGNVDQLNEFFEWVRQRSHLVSGATINTMLRTEGFHFTRIGTFLERADNTARMLDVNLRVLAAEGGARGPEADYYRYSQLLRSLSALQIYRQAYRDRITPDRVAELLILHPDMPRSLHRCLEEITANLRRVANSQSAETERRAGQLHAELQFGRIDSVLARGVHKVLADFLERIQDLGSRISTDFLLSEAW
ncbi:MAG: alpha-E domain-containing protein [Gammaproteobacteria bacterium]